MDGGSCSFKQIAMVFLNRQETLGCTPFVF